MAEKHIKVSDVIMKKTITKQTIAFDDNFIVDLRDRQIYDHEKYSDSCGVGFITHKNSQQTHDVLAKSHEALCTIPHRGGMSAEGIGDGAGVNIDLSQRFFQKIANQDDLELGKFGVANFFLPRQAEYEDDAIALVEEKLRAFNFPILLWRDVPVNNDALNDASVQAQLPLKQVVFLRSNKLVDASWNEFDSAIAHCLQAIEDVCYEMPELDGFYPCSMSARTQVLKGRLNSNEVMPYFEDLMDPDHEIHSLFFHTRFSTNTEPATMMAQPFRRMAHNGELNTDKKNRLSEKAIATQQGKTVHFPKGQSDSARLDQTIARRIVDDGMNVVEAIVAMMPPAWENISDLNPDVAAMLEYFSLYEEKNDGPAALVFGNGQFIGARLDRLGLRPLRLTETEEYLTVMSESGQIDFPAETVIKRGRIEAGDMVFWSHEEGRSYNGAEYLQKLAARKDYKKLLDDAVINLADLAETKAELAKPSEGLDETSQQVAYYLNQESLRFMLDPMLNNGAERVYAMGYGLTPNALSDDEGGMSQYFSQRFAQVTNPPLDSIREADGMTLRVALGGKPGFVEDQQQIIIQSPVLLQQDLTKILAQTSVATRIIPITYQADYNNAKRNASQLELALAKVCNAVEKAARDNIGIIVLSDREISTKQAAIPLLLAVASANQRLIKKGLRFNSSLIVDSGQIVSTHDVATTLGFGASAIFAISAQSRAEALNAETADKAMQNFQKAINKSLMKTMGKFGLCTAESYIGGEFFESSFLDTKEPHLKQVFPGIDAPVGGVHFLDIATSSAKWHALATAENQQDLPNLGLFKERAEGAGHSFGVVSVREYGHMYKENITYIEKEQAKHLKLLGDEALGSDEGYQDFGYEARTPEQIDAHKISPNYTQFITEMTKERHQRPAALRDVMGLPVDVSAAKTTQQFDQLLGSQKFKGNSIFVIRGLHVEQKRKGVFKVYFESANDEDRLIQLKQHFEIRFPHSDHKISLQKGYLTIAAGHYFLSYLKAIKPAPKALPLEKVQPAHEITKTFASGAMSYGALVKPAHRAASQGTNIVGGLSNSGEGGEEFIRSNSILASRIKQFASGRFGVWAGFLADPLLEEVEIKIAQGAKPGEGGQLPAKKVTVEIAAMRGGTPGVELVSPPPHHDTYSIEDLGQLIHDCKATRRRVVVKLVSSEGIGTIAVGVAKAGADVINVAGNTGGTGAAQVTSLKHTGRAAEIGIAEVHKALSANGLRDKVILRTSGAHQMGTDVIKSALLGADSFEFGTAVLMMLGCVQAKTCNIKCPVGLTTNPEAYDGDARVLAQYYMNLAQEVRLLLANLGFSSLAEIRGRSELLHLIDHEKIVGELDLRGLLAEEDTVVVDQPVYLEANFKIDDMVLEAVKEQIFSGKKAAIVLQGDRYKLNNRDKTVGGQLAIDVERALNYELDQQTRNGIKSAIHTAANGRRYFGHDATIRVNTTGSAGQSYGAFNIVGMHMHHEGTCNDGVGKGASGGVIAIKIPENDGVAPTQQNTLIGNFALFGAVGGQAYINGEAGDRFAVRNSGAMAVVEGLGDFGCEYMINGSVLNIGTFGKGLGNGMSGGFAYQYDPENRIEVLYDASSVKYGHIADNSDEALGHEQFIKHMLEQHVQYTGSSKAKMLLENWAEERAHFLYLQPIALQQTQSAQSLVTLGRKVMLEELSFAMADYQLTPLKKVLIEGGTILDGHVPAYQQVDTALSFDLLNAYGVMRMAKQAVHTLAKKKSIGEVSELFESSVAQNLIKTEDYALLEALAKECKKALERYNEEELSIILADKRIRDYKKSLTLRDVQSVYSLGSTAWIIAQDRVNAEAMGHLPDFRELIAEYLVKAVLTANKAA